MQFPIYSDHGASMRNKIVMFSQYKFVLAFENSNTTDYVSEKVFNALQSGALPVYMGSETIDDFLPVIWILFEAFVRKYFDGADVVSLFCV